MRNTLVAITTILLIVIPSNQLLFLRLISWSDTLRPQVGVLTILLPQLRCFKLALFIVRHREVAVKVVKLVLVLLRIHPIHILLKEALYLSLGGLLIGFAKRPSNPLKIILLLLDSPPHRPTASNTLLIRST